MPSLEARGPQVEEEVVVVVTMWMTRKVEENLSLGKENTNLPAMDDFGSLYPLLLSLFSLGIDSSSPSFLVGP